jgi:hypothetical protein
LWGSSASVAGEVAAGGALDIEIGGFVEMLAVVGDAEEKRGGDGRSIDFFTDTEVELSIEAEHAATGIAYGSRITLEADTDDDTNTGETWLFINGGFGEVRLGDDDGAAESLAVGGFSVAVGTGGIDGDDIGTPAVTTIEGSGDATKIVYFAPELAGIGAAVSYTPAADSEGSDLAVTDTGDLKDVVEAGVEYVGEIGEADLLAALTGMWGRFDSDADIGHRSAWGLQAGAKAELGDRGLGAGIGAENLGGFERTWINLGASWTIAPVEMSITYGRVLAADGPNGSPSERPWNLVLGAETGIAPGLVGSFELSWFDDSRVDDDAGRFMEDDGGVLGLARIAVSF